MAADWSTLPLDLLATIVLKLETFEDFIYFSAVCHWWNHVSSSTKHQWRAIPMPWLLLAENNKNNPDCVRKILNLSNNKCYKFTLPETFGARCWGSPYGWIAMIDRNFDVQLFNPITKAQIHFPCLKPLDSGIAADESVQNYQSWFLGCFANRLIVLKVPQNDDYKFVVLVIHEYYQSLAFARQGDQSWTPIFVKSRVKMVDIVGMEDKVFALYENGSIVFWNVKKFNAHKLIKPKRAAYSPRDRIFVEFNRGSNQIYLVRSGSDLLVVLRYIEEVGNADDTDYDYDIVYRTIGFEVYKLNRKAKIWEEIEDLGEVALVVGGNSSMCIFVAHAKGLQRNCIYFSDDQYVFWRRVREHGGHDTGACDFKSGKIWPIYQGDDMRSSFSPPTLFIPQL
ncbi:F-box protein At2g05970-like [Silene latifolia]|uniref:F-box protein At2g05970-like n=1 Tax=Silene latifolia TaxID=37657 RepID=UPI003D7893E5